MADPDHKSFHLEQELEGVKQDVAHLASDVASVKSTLVSFGASIERVSKQLQEFLTDERRAGRGAVSRTLTIAIAIGSLTVTAAGIYTNLINRPIISALSRHEADIASITDARIDRAYEGGRRDSRLENLDERVWRLERRTYGLVEEPDQ